MMFLARAVLYSGWKLNFRPLQVNGLVFMNPFAPEAIMKPVCPVDQSVSLASSAWPPGIFALNICTVIRSPGFILSVCRFGVNVRKLDSCGLGGPVGTPFVWTNPKLAGSMHLLLQVFGAIPFPVHSRLSMVSAEHQWVLSQLMLSANGANPGG